jgi:hypothetical protein
MLVYLERMNARTLSCSNVYFFALKFRCRKLLGDSHRRPTAIYDLGRNRIRAVPLLLGDAVISDHKFFPIEPVPCNPVVRWCSWFITSASQAN